MRPGPARAGGVRALAVWCSDWPVVAAGIPLDRPAVVVRASRIVACSPAARANGVARHQRRREAQARCPELIVVEHDPALDARMFEPVVAALDALTPRIEIVHPGCCVFPTRGPSRYFGGDRALAGLAAELAAGVLAGRGPVQVGVADGPFAARLAARSTIRGSGEPRRPGSTEVDVPVVVEPGDSARFLATRPVTALDRPELAGVLQRLGLRRLGDLAALPAADVVGRFGAEGAIAHRLASGLDERPPATAPPPVDLSVSVELDPPAERIEAAAFVARGLADELQARLSGRGSACTQLVIGAETEHGERHERAWRTEGRFTTMAIADRVRWQIEGWLHAGGHRPTGGLIRLWLVPGEVVPAGGRQLTFTPAGPGAVDAVEAADRAARALARVQGLAGGEAVHVPEWRGGRGPGERVALVPAAAVDVTEPRPAAQDGWVTEPWPGRVPDPAPATVHDPPLPAEVTGADGRPVVVGGRGVISAAPVMLAVGVARPPGPAGSPGPVGPPPSPPSPPSPGAAVSPVSPGAAVSPGSPPLPPSPGSPGSAGSSSVGSAARVGSAGLPGRRAPGSGPDGGAARRAARGGPAGRESGHPGGAAGGRSVDRQAGEPVRPGGGRSPGDAAGAGVEAAARRGGSGVRVAAWAGPWPCAERWWDPEGRRRRARLQVMTAEGRAYLLIVEAGRWAVEATYD